MIWILAGIVGAFAVVFVGYLQTRAQRGLSTAVRLHRFEEVYDAVSLQSGSKETALETAFAEFQTCPGLRELTSEEADYAI